MEFAMTVIDLPTLAKRVHGELFARGVEVVPPDVIITGASPLADAQPGHITLIDHEKHVPRLQSSPAAACVTKQSLPEISIPQIVVPNPHEAFSKICELFRPHVIVKVSSGIDPRAMVAESASVPGNAIVEAGASIGEACVVGERTHIHRGVTIMDGCKVGSDCQLFPGVVLYPGTVVEDRVTLHANCVLGAHGFGYRMVDGKHVSTSQLGWVHVENDVEIGANTTVDRGTYGATRIGAGTKIDNLVMIAHNCNIGKHNLICSQVGIAGSSSTGDYVVLAGQVGVRDHTHIGSRTMVGAQSGVASDVAEDQIMLGSPALPRMDQAKLFAATNRLPEMRIALKKLEKQVDALVTRTAKSSE
jgi:UDP-3-O-[3-hydroxymyristoyl] glucosamine N-acyltransferase